MITSLEYLENWTLINKCVKVQFDAQSEGKIKAEFDKNKIKEMDALSLIQEYIKHISQSIN